MYHVIVVSEKILEQLCGVHIFVLTEQKQNRVVSVQLLLQI